jgi:hypothetical protein
MINAANFLRFSATVEEIVDRILMNLHPDVLTHAASLPCPTFYHQSSEMVGHVEEKMAVQRERQMTRAEHANCKLAVAVAVVSEPSESTAVWNFLGHRSRGCWRCGQLGHLARN